MYVCCVSDFMWTVEGYISAFNEPASRILFEITTKQQQNK